MDKLIVGCGYLGKRVAQRWLADTHSDVAIATRSDKRDSEPQTNLGNHSTASKVYALTRSSEHADEFASLGILPLVGDITRPTSLPTIPPVDHVLFAVGFDHRATDVSIDQVFVAGLKNLVAVLPPTVRRLVYISSTGVYGQTSGEWVDENSPCQPSRAGGRACYDAELFLRQSDLAKRIAILRLSGIYGPGRLPRQNDVLAGKPLETPEHGFLNLIHVDDAVAVVLRVFTEPESAFPLLINVTDGHPVVRRDYLCELARLLKAPNPVFAPAAAAAHVTQRAAADKRVSNRRMLALQVPLRYPTFREGLRGILDITNDSRN